ncbi:aminopeptidase P family protein [Eubacterium oxidoreducens]|uniref:Xaa-Pro aminopeptidase n=1 Tax=Eubacterium oxidoreducens TaxID=1732 RepID=A0A1G6BHZ3_EUBOX|nr:aminopeptidase P family protein [Eubacterium oxidoreducens]SDB20226.1 Xaa-Pro aminopeptidase [Eubacterium oxidoreducens]
MNTITKRLEQLRTLMRGRNISYYLIPTSDFHQSEYVGEHFKERSYMSGFTGSAGTLLVGIEKAYLWTDGRYFVQAKRQLEESDIELMRIGVEGVPTISEFLTEHLKEGDILGFDGRVVSAKLGETYLKLTGQKHGSIYTAEDLVDLIWNDRPQLPSGKVWILEESYAGETALDKIERLRKKMKEEHANVHLLTSLYDIAWLLNLRGADIEHVPVVMSFLIVYLDQCVLYINPENIDDKVAIYLEQIGVNRKPYESVYDDLAQFMDRRVLAQKSIINYRMGELLQGNEIINRPNPTEMMKCIKNETELRNTVLAHVKDGVAMTRFMYYLKTGYGKEHMTELSTTQVLEELRKKQEGFLDLSFDTIAAYGEHGAMMHYAATKESDVKLGDGFFLVDSGGHYLEGTTDITRTFCFGELTKKQKEHYTITLKSNLALANAKFLKGTRGSNLDILAREPFWEIGMDYKCGTGHGVGHILNVHEGPNSFRWRVIDEAALDAVLEEGMITTDEPGVYLEGEYGIRLENELICREGIKNENGQFMEFEVITYCPFDLDGVDKTLMSKKEIAWLNQYHDLVYRIISPHLSPEEKQWLKKATREI